MSRKPVPPELLLAAKILALSYEECVKRRFRPPNADVTFYAERLRNASRSRRPVDEEVYRLFQITVFAFGRKPKPDDDMVLKLKAQAFIDRNRELLAELEFVHGGEAVQL